MFVLKNLVVVVISQAPVVNTCRNVQPYLAYYRGILVCDGVC